MSAFKLKNLLSHCAKLALTHKINIKLGHWGKDHNRRAALRHYAKAYVVKAVVPASP